MSFLVWQNTNIFIKQKCKKKQIASDCVVAGVPARPVSIMNPIVEGEGWGVLKFKLLNFKISFQDYNFKK